MDWNKDSRNQKNLRKMTLTDKEKIKEALDMIEKMIEDVEGDYEQGVPRSSEKIEVLEN